MNERKNAIKIPGTFDPNSVDYNIWMFLCPSTVDWDAIYLGLLARPTRGRIYDGSTGSIVGAQSIARGVFESLMIVNASDLINSIREVAKAIAGGSVDYDQPWPRQVSYSGNDWETLLGNLDLSVVNNLSIEPAAVNVTNNLPELSTTVKNYNSVTCSSCGGCGGGGAGVGEGAYQGGDPPPGYSEPTFGGEDTPPGTIGYDTRKCFIANYLVDSLIIMFRKVDSMPYVGTTVEVLTTLFGAIWLSTVGGLILAYVGPETLIGAILVGVATTLDNFSAEIVKQDCDLAEIADELELNKSDYVCALYSSFSATQAVSGLIGVASDNGLGATNLAVLSIIVVVDFAAILFYDWDGFKARIEKELETYQPEIDCHNCDFDIIFPFDTDLEGWRLIESAPEVNLPGGNVPNAGQQVEWVYDTIDSFMRMTTGPTPSSCLVSSPPFSKAVTALTHIQFTFRCANATVQIWINLSDTGWIAPYGTGVSYGETNYNVDLGQYAGESVTQIIAYVAASAAGPRTLEFDYINIFEVQ